MFVLGLAGCLESLCQPDYLFGWKLLNQLSSFSIYDSHNGPSRFAVKCETDFVTFSGNGRLFQLLYGL